MPVVEIHASKALFARPARGVSMFAGGAGDGRTAGGALLVDVVGWNDGAGAEAAIVNAARFWNLYHGNYTGRPFLVRGSIVADWSHRPATTGKNVIGLAYNAEARCKDGVRRRHLFCRGGVVQLDVLALYAHLAFDVFVHEIAHAVVPIDSSVVDASGAVVRVIDNSRHWHPAEPSEIFGREISSSPFAAAYTLRAADVNNSHVCGGGKVVVCDWNMSCQFPAGYRGVPALCAPGGKWAANRSTTTIADAAVDVVSSSAGEMWLGGGVILSLSLILILMCVIGS